MQSLGHLRQRPGDPAGGSGAAADGSGGGLPHCPGLRPGCGENAADLADRRRGSSPCPPGKSSPIPGWITSGPRPTPIRTRAAPPQRPRGPPSAPAPWRWTPAISPTEQGCSSWPVTEAMSTASPGRGLRRRHQGRPDGPVYAYLRGLHGLRQKKMHRILFGLTGIRHRQRHHEKKGRYWIFGTWNRKLGLTFLSIYIILSINEYR